MEATELAFLEGRVFRLSNQSRWRDLCSYRNLATTTMITVGVALMAIGRDLRVGSRSGLIWLEYL